MFFHPEHGLVLNHTRQQFSRLKRGEGFGYIKWRDVASIFDWVVREGKSYAIYPRMKLDRKIVGFIVANYPDYVVENNAEFFERHLLQAER